MAQSTGITAPTDTSFQGRFNFQQARLLQIVSRVQNSIAAILYEYVENALDARATEVLISLSPTKIIITDNGHGMVPYITPDDKAVLEVFFEDISRGNIDPTDDVRNDISEPSKKSLEWLATSIGWSGKLPEQNLLGRLGIGGQGFRQIANSASWVTKPDQELAMEYWGKSSTEAKNPPVYTLNPPTVSMVDAYQVDYKISSASPGAPFLDATGKTLRSGTRVEISEIRPEALSGLRIRELERQLSERYGAKIHELGCTITIVDRISEEGKKSQKGILIPIRETALHGVLVYDQEVNLKGMEPFRVFIMYDANGRGLHVKYRQAGVDKMDIDLPQFHEFQGTILGSGKLNGYISYPGGPDALHDLNKGVPSPGRIRSRWAEVVLLVLDQVADQIQKLEDTARNQTLSKAAQEISAKISEAISEIEGFDDLQIGTPDPKKKPEKTTKPSKPSKPDERVTVRVQNEHGKGIAGVKVELFCKGKLIKSSTTGSAGEISFGRILEECGAGRYELRITVSEGVKLLDAYPFAKFDLDAGHPSKRHIFHLLTGELAPQVNKLPRLRPMLSAFEGSDAQLLWRTPRIEAGLVDINSAHPDYQNALDTKNEELLFHLIAHSIIAAIASWHFRARSPQEACHASSLLYARVVPTLVKRRGVRSK